MPRKPKTTAEVIPQNQVALEPTAEERATAAEFQLAESTALLEAANRQNAILAQKASEAELRGSLDPATLNHPNAFKGKDGRTYYKYELDGDTVVLPKPLDKMGEEDFYRLPISLFDNAVGRLPNNLTVEFKDPQWAGHWFNKKAGDAARVSVGLTLGFVPAKIEDLKTYYKGLNDMVGAVEQHDLVLMKIHKAKLYMKYATWINSARKRGGIDAYKTEAESGNRDTKHVSYYHTPQALSEPQGLGAASAVR